MFKNLQTGMWRWDLSDPEMADKDLLNRFWHGNDEQGASGNAAGAELSPRLVELTSDDHALNDFSNKEPLREEGHASNSNVGKEDWMYGPESHTKWARDIIGAALGVQEPPERDSAPDESTKRQTMSRKSGFFSRLKRS